MNIIGHIEKVGGETNIVVGTRAFAGRIAVYGKFFDDLADGQVVYLKVSPERFEPLNEPPLIEEELQDERRQQRIKAAVAAEMDSR